LVKENESSFLIKRNKTKADENGDTYQFLKRVVGMGRKSLTSSELGGKAERKENRF
jgi:hypothetical protein